MTRPKESILRQIATYFFIRKPDPTAPRSINMSLMHGMNRISLIIFLIAIIVIVVRAVRN
jgi:hypothetical protein